jgi:hypothetical protein
LLCRCLLQIEQQNKKGEKTHANELRGKDIDLHL